MKRVNFAQLNYFSEVNMKQSFVKIILKFFLFSLFFSLLPLQSESSTKDPTPIVKKMIGFIRYKKNSNALSQIDTETYSSNLLKGEYESLSSDQKKEFEDAVKLYIENKSFPVALKYFDKVDINYEKPIFKGNFYEIPSSILYNGSQQIKFSWILTEKNGSFLISDFLVENKLTSEVNREKLLAVLKKDGFVKMIEKLRDAASK